jgi:hypothetical protein
MTKTEQIRLSSWRFKVLQRAAASRGVARTCRHFGISRQAFYIYGLLPKSKARLVID